MTDQAPNKWPIALTVMTPTAMEILDTSVANVALAHIQGALNAGLDEVTWVLTSYLVANGVVLPMTGWIASRFGRKRWLFACVLGFTVASFLCGSATSLSGLIFFRVLQGLFGGSLQPMSQAILLESFPREEQGTAMAFYAMGIVTAPIFGPMLGGYITDHLSWRWVFFINVPVGIVSALAILAVLHDPAYLKHQRRPLDWVGLGLLVVGIGTLQIMLDRGNQEDWFESRAIVLTALTAGIALVGLVTWELVFSRHPIVDLRIFAVRSFGVGALVIFFVYSAFFASLVLLPLYLQTLMDYTAFQAGLVLGPGGVATVIMLPFVGRLVRRGWGRQVLLVGLVVAAASVHLMARFSLQADFHAVLMPRIVQGVGLACFFVPLTTLTMADIPQVGLGNATGLFALLRNLGGSIGVAVSATLLAHRTQFHHARLVERWNAQLPASRDLLKGAARQLVHNGVPTAASPAAALGQVSAELTRQATMLAFNDGFTLLFVVMLCVVPLVFLFPKRRDAGEVAALAH